MVPAFTWFRLPYGYRVYLSRPEQFLLGRGSAYIANSSWFQWLGSGGVGHTTSPIRNPGSGFSFISSQLSWLPSQIYRWRGLFLGSFWRFIVSRSDFRIFDPTELTVSSVLLVPHVQCRGCLVRWIGGGSVAWDRFGVVSNCAPFDLIPSSPDNFSSLLSWSI